MTAIGRSPSTRRKHLHSKDLHSKHLHWQKIRFHIGGCCRIFVGGIGMNVSSGKKKRADIDMRVFAKSAGATIKVPAGATVFNKGEAGECMYIVQFGTIDMMIGDKVIESIGANEALGFMSMIDDNPRSSTA
ncbi:MAG: cyclic nucleotide-binding domain-containing protein, partial [Pseudolabrys sp.]|nr:cyclic nucleotide-binding domain-containing protein [Pseudolabrys sp.]